MVQGALAGEGDPAHIDAIAEFFRRTCLGFQLGSDVTSMRNGDASACGTLTMPVVKTLAKLSTKEERQRLHRQLKSAAEGRDVNMLCKTIEQSGGFTAVRPHLLSCCVRS
jgi:geranylgeranyl pyrophosphate synthase